MAADATTILAVAIADASNFDIESTFKHLKKKILLWTHSSFLHIVLAGTGLVRCIACFHKVSTNISVPTATLACNTARH